MNRRADDVHVPLTVEGDSVTAIGKPRLTRRDWRMLAIVLVGALILAACLAVVVRLSQRAPALPPAYTHPR